MANLTLSRIQAAEQEFANNECLKRKQNKANLDNYIIKHIKKLDIDKLVIESIKKYGKKSSIRLLYIPLVKTSWFGRGDFHTNERGIEASINRINLTKIINDMFEDGSNHFKVFLETCYIEISGIVADEAFKRGNFNIFKQVHGYNIRISID